MGVIGVSRDWLDGWLWLFGAMDESSLILFGFIPTQLAPTQLAPRLDGGIRLGYG